MISEELCRAGRGRGKGAEGIRGFQNGMPKNLGSL